MKNKMKTYEYRFAQRKRKWAPGKHAQDVQVPSVPQMEPDNLPSVTLRTGHVWPDEVRFALNEMELSKAIARIGNRRKAGAHHQQNRLRTWAGRTRV